MHATPEVVRYLLQERSSQIAQARIERLAACARVCREATESLMTRLTRLLRPVVAP
jgi:hypothetical protein